jgi:hypothetical protein
MYPVRKWSELLTSRHDGRKNDVRLSAIEQTAHKRRYNSRLNAVDGRRIRREFSTAIE